MGVTRGAFAPLGLDFLKKKCIFLVFIRLIHAPPRANFTSLVKKSTDAYDLKGSLPLSSIENSFRVLKRLSERVFEIAIYFLSN
jgi:hypothetical protein